MASLCDDHGYVVEKLKCNATIFLLTVDIAVSHEMVLFSSDSFISFDTMFLVYEIKMSFWSRVCLQVALYWIDDA